MPIQAYERHVPGVNDLVVLHSFYSRIPEELELMQRDFTPEVVFRARSIIVPLLGDDLTMPTSDLQYTNSYLAFGYRFSRQRFESVIARLGPRTARDPASGEEPRGGMRGSVHHDQRPRLRESRSP